MSKILAVILLNLRKQLNDKAFLVMIGLPLIFTLIFGKAFGGGTSRIPVAAADLDNSKLSGAIIKMLEKNESINLTSGNSEEVVKLVQDKKVEAAVVIPAGFYDNVRNNKRTTIQTIALPNNQNEIAIRQIVTGVAARIDANAAAAQVTVEQMKKNGGLTLGRAEELWDSAYEEAEKRWIEPPISVSLTEDSEGAVKKSNINTMTHFSLGFSLAFVMFTLTFGAGVILEERENGTWGRLLSAPVHPGQIMAGHMAATFIVGWVQVAILILVGKYLFGVNWGANLAATILLMSVYLFAVTGFGLMLAGFVKTNAQLQAVTPIVMTSFAMLGGAYWPLDIVPAKMQLLAKFVPTGQAMEGLLDIVARGKGIAEVQQPILILLAMGILFFSIGLLRVTPSRC